METLLFLSLQLTLAGSQSLQYFYTAVTPGLYFPEFTIVGLVNGEPFLYYDSNVRKMVPKQECLGMNLFMNDPDYWDRETQSSQAAQTLFKENLHRAMNRFQMTTGHHTVQKMYGCEQDSDGGMVGGHMQYSFDGEDFLSLDVKTLSWVAAHPNAVITKHKWDVDEGQTVGKALYLNSTCINWLKKYILYCKETVMRTVRPEVTLFQKHPSSPELVCHATGFFPAELDISWRKNGDEMFNNIEVSETIPNQDGSFQKRTLLSISPEDLQKHKISCVVQHSSMKEKLVLPASERRILRGERYSGIFIAVGVTALLLFMICAGGICLCRKSMWSRRGGEEDFHRLPFRN